MDGDQTRHKLFDQAVNSLCVVSLIFCEAPEGEKEGEERVQEKREFASLGQGLFSLKGNYMSLMWTPACGLCQSYSPLFFLCAQHRLVTGAAHFFCSVHTLLTACGLARVRLTWHSHYIQNNCHPAKKMFLFVGILWSCTGLECASWFWESMTSLLTYPPVQRMALGLILKKFFAEGLLQCADTFSCTCFALFYFVSFKLVRAFCLAQNLLMLACSSNLAESLSLVGF